MALSANELLQENKRLKDILSIFNAVSIHEDTSLVIDSILQQLTQAFDASGSLLYLTDQGALHLFRRSEEEVQAQAPLYLGETHSLEKLVLNAGHALCFHVMTPDKLEADAEQTTMACVIDEVTSQVHQVFRAELPSFKTLLVSPVIFSGRVIGLFEVGWNTLRPMPPFACELLDAVSNYLAFQLACTVTDRRLQYESRLRNLSMRIRETIFSYTSGEYLTDSVLCELANSITQMTVSEIDSEFFLISYRYATQDNAVVVQRVNGGSLPIPQDLIDDLDISELIFVRPSSALGAYLGEVGISLDAVLINMDSPMENADGMLIGFSHYAQAMPFDDQVLELLRAIASDFQELIDEQVARQSEHHISQALQQGMKNELSRVEGLTAEGVYSSATTDAFVGGDFYSLIRLTDSRSCIVLGDVSGKGVEAASISSALRTAVTAYAWQGIRPSAMARMLNEFMLNITREDTFATLFIGIINSYDATLTYCSAGHPPALLARADTGEIERLSVQSGLVGAFSNISYFDGTVHLNKGDTLVLYTDGTTEARNSEGEFFGDVRLISMVAAEFERGTNGMVERMLVDIERFCGHRLQDDVALVSVRFDGKRVYSATDNVWHRAPL